MSRSVSFYENGLGLKTLSSRSVCDAYVLQIVQVQGAERIDITFLGLPTGDVVVELLHYVGELGASASATHPGAPGAAHLCLLVDDIEDAWQRALAAGGRARSPRPVRIESGPYQGGYGCYLADPDGYWIELLQPPTG